MNSILEYNDQDFRQQVIQALEELSEELASIQKTLACFGTSTEKESTNGPTSLGTSDQK